jgi:hypothetical protein
MEVTCARTEKESRPTCPDEQDGEYVFTKRNWRGCDQCTLHIPRSTSIQLASEIMAF